MLNFELLDVLSPLDLTGSDSAENAALGASLDKVDAARVRLQAELFPASADLLLYRWEQLLDLTPAATDTVHYRRDKVIAKLRNRGLLTPYYFQTLALAMGVIVTIYENIGDRFTWGVATPDEVVHYFSSGQSFCGECLVTYQPDRKSVV